MSQAVPGITREDVIQRVLSVWPSDLRRVMSELDSYTGPERERVQLDAIALSQGSLEHLSRWLRNYEYREIIAAAEYGDPEVLRRFDEQTTWKPDNESEVSFRGPSRHKQAGLRNRAGALRWRSEAQLGGLPLVSIAIGPDPPRGEIRGHAKGVVAIGDLATGWLALGGLARGGIAIGGVAIGLVSLGGVGLGLLTLGGAAIGGVAFGGAAVGAVAVGGAAIGYYALGGAAIGKHVVSEMVQDPEALRFFAQYLPWLKL
jgi:hypothetical protein